MYNMQTVNFTKYFQIVFQGDILTLTFHQLPIMTSSYYSTSLSVLDTAKLLNFHQSRGVKYHLNLLVMELGFFLIICHPCFFISDVSFRIFYSFFKWVDIFIIIHLFWILNLCHLVLQTSLFNYWLVFSLFKNYLSPNRIP